MSTPTADLITQLTTPPPPPSVVPSTPKVKKVGTKKPKATKNSIADNEYSDVIEPLQYWSLTLQRLSTDDQPRMIPLVLPQLLPHIKPVVKSAKVLLDKLTKGSDMERVSRLASALSSYQQALDKLTPTTSTATATAE